MSKPAAPNEQQRLTSPILNGEKSAELPILRAAKFEPRHQLATAKMLGIEFRSRCWPAPTKRSNS
jgi:hypothetical protein